MVFLKRTIKLIDIRAITTTDIAANHNLAAVITASIISMLVIDQGKTPSRHDT